MFLLKACSSSHSCCLGLAGLTNAGLVLGPERALSQGPRGARTHTVPGSCFSFTFNTSAERDKREGRGERRVVCRRKKRERVRERRRRRVRLIKRDKSKMQRETTREQSFESAA